MLKCPVCDTELSYGEAIDDGKYPLTKRQREIMDFLTAYHSANQYAPSFDEIAAHFHYNSLATVHGHLNNLAHKGFIRRRYNESRSIVIL